MGLMARRGSRFVTAKSCLLYTKLTHDAPQTIAMNPEDDEQYILTLNVDRLEHCREEAWYGELEQSVVASFTKSDRFLKTHYQEISV